MAFPNDQIVVTPGTGKSAGFHTILGKKYEVFILSDPTGNLDKQFNDYTVVALALPSVASKHYLGIANYVNSNVMVEVIGVAVWAETVVGLTGFESGLQLLRLTSMTGGTQIANANVQKLATSQPNLAAGVVAFRNNYVAAGLVSETLSAGAIGTAEAGWGGWKTWLYEPHSSQGKLLLSTGQGITIQQSTTSALASVSAIIHFRTY